MRIAVTMHVGSETSGGSMFDRKLLCNCVGEGGGVEKGNGDDSEGEEGKGMGRKKGKAEAIEVED